MQPNIDQVGAREILDALPDGAYITDPNRKIVFWSRAAERITGWRAEDVVGHSCSDNILVHIDKDGHTLCQDEHCPLHRAMVTGKESSGPMLVFAKHKQGHRIPVQVAVAPLQDAAGRTLGGIEVFRDLTGMLNDLRRAKAIQDHALESALPADDRVRFEVRYQPEELVGGDFYRVERIGEDDYFFMVADVMGHGIASALYTMQLRSIWEECRATLVSPDMFMGQLNERLHTLASPDGYFATGFAALLDLAHDRLVYVRAGHPPPFLVREAGTVDRLTARSPAIGLREGISFQPTEERIARGDTLVLYTDGAIEITNAKGEELGEEGLQNLLQKREGRLDLGRIEQQLLDYCDQVRLPDDLTLLSVSML